jgi:hypothetical protein
MLWFRKSPDVESMRVDGLLTDAQNADARLALKFTSAAGLGVALQVNLTAIGCASVAVAKARFTAANHAATARAARFGVGRSLALDGAVPAVFGVVDEVNLTAVVILGVAVAITVVAATNFAKAVVRAHRSCVGQQARRAGFSRATRGWVIQ